MYDTLGYVKKLEAVGIPRLQAEAQVEIMSNFIDQNFATKQDLNQQMTMVRSDMSHEFAAVRSDMAAEFGAVRSEMKTEFAAVRSEMKTEFAAVRGEMKTEFAAVRGEIQIMRAELTRDLTIRLGGMIAASTVLTVSITAIMLSILLRH